MHATAAGFDEAEASDDAIAMTASPKNATSTARYH